MKYTLGNSPYLPGYDNWKTSKLDEDYYEDEDGEEGCDHDWKFLGMSADGDSFYKCRGCGEEDN